jgi:hypothetical protein
VQNRFQNLPFKFNLHRYVKAAARAIDAAAVKAVVPTTTATTTTPCAANNAMREDSAMGGGEMGSVGPASVGSKPVSKFADMSPAAFSFEYTPFSKPSAVAAAAGTEMGAEAGVGEGMGAGKGAGLAMAPAFGASAGGVGVVSLAADFAGAADVELFTVLTTLMQCMLALIAVASRSVGPVALFGAKGCVKVASGMLVTALVVIGMMLFAEVGLVRVESSLTHSLKPPGFNP